MGTAHITCPECSFVSKTYTRVENKRKSWVLSNFNKHFKNKHLKVVTQPSNPARQGKTTNSSILSFIQVIPNPISPTLIQPEQNSSPTIFTGESSNSTTTEITRNSVTNLTTSDESLIILTEPEASNQENVVISDVLPNGEDLLSPNFGQGLGQGNITEEETQLKSETSSNTESNTQTEDQTLNPQKIYSRQKRLLRKRQLQFDEEQLKITDFFNICNKIQNYLINDSSMTKQLNVIFKAVQNKEESRLEEKSNNEVIKSFFEMIKQTALKNSKTQSKESNRFSHDLKKLCLYIFITSGRLAYETLCSNMSNALPSITTLYRTFDTFTKTFEGQIQMHELKTFLLKRNYPLKVFISEDQTAIVKRVRYNSHNNQMVGFVLKRSELTGFPLENQYLVSDIKNGFENGVLSNYAYIFMAQPLVDHAPAFCLVIFGSDNRFSADEVLKRWSHLENEANAIGISVEGFSSDGDTRCLKAMKVKTNFPSASSVTSPYSPYFQVIFFTIFLILIGLNERSPLNVLLSFFNTNPQEQIDPNKNC